MIVKFIAVICLLLFIPKLEIKNDNDNMEDDSRKLINCKYQFYLDFNYLKVFLAQKKCAKFHLWLMANHSICFFFSHSFDLIPADSSLERLNNLTAMVNDAIEKYQNANGIDNEDCSSVSCRMRRFLVSGETWEDNFKLFQKYVSEEEVHKEEERKNVDT